MHGPASHCTGNRRSLGTTDLSDTPERRVRPAARHKSGRVLGTFPLGTSGLTTRVFPFLQFSSLPSVQNSLSLSLSFLFVPSSFSPLALVCTRSAVPPLATGAFTSYHCRLYTYEPVTRITPNHRLSRSPLQYYCLRAPRSLGHRPFTN